MTLPVPTDEKPKYTHRIRNTWGRGSWSYDYYKSIDDAIQAFNQGHKGRYDFFGNPKQPQRRVIQEVVRFPDKWKNVDLAIGIMHGGRKVIL